MPNSSWPRHRRRGADTVPSVVCSCCTFMMHGECEHVLYERVLLGDPAVNLKNPSCVSEAARENRDAWTAPRRQLQRQRRFRKCRKHQQEVKSELTPEPSAAARAQTSRKCTSRSCQSCMLIMSSIMHESPVSETRCVAHVSRASFISRSFCHQKLSSSRALIELFRTHHTGILFANGAGLRPPQPAVFL